MSPSVIVEGVRELAARNDCFFRFTRIEGANVVATTWPSLKKAASTPVG